MGILRLGGLASGLDTDALIKQLMSLERRPVTQLEQKRDTLQSEANAWRDINSRLLTLQKRVAELKNVSASTWSAMKVTVSDASIYTASAESTAAPGDYTVQVVRLASATTWRGNRSVSDPAADLAPGAGTIRMNMPGNATYNGRTLAVDADDSLNDIAQKINDAAKDPDTDLGITASVIQVSPNDYRLVLTGKTGAANDFSISDETGTVADWLQITTAYASAKTQPGVNAQVRINGIDIDSSTNTFKDAIPGVTLNVLKVGTASVTVSKDQDKVVGAVKAVIDQYNSVVDFVDSLTKYDTKTKKAGTLFGEGLTGNIKSTLSRLFSDPVNGLPDEFNSLAMVGIGIEKFVSKDAPKTQKLSFDEAKFKAALAKDPDMVKDLFTKDVEGNPDKGIAVRLESWLNDYTSSGGSILSKATSLDDEIEDMKDKITRWDETILPLREQRLRTQFVALEKAMSTFQSQGNWLSSQLSSLASFGPLQRT